MTSPCPAVFAPAVPDGATLLLGGTVGSTAYGLAREGSDTDRLGVFAHPTPRLVGLTRPSDSVVVHEPDDVAAHEVGKMLTLLLKVNPTVTELLWLPADLIEHAHPLGLELVALRRSFLSAPYVRNAYVGYAHAQLARVDRRGDQNLTNGGDARNEKAARHVLRLLVQAKSLWATGTLTVRLDDPESYFAFGRLGWDAQAARFEQEKAWFDTAPTVLPDEPDRPAAEDFLARVRREFWTAA